MSTDIVEEMLAELAVGKQSMTRQVATIADVIEKSNNVLLQVEATRSLKSNTTRAPHCFNKETMQTLAKCIQLFPETLSHNTSAEANELAGADGFEEYLKRNRARMDHLGSSIRKLFAIGEIVGQIKTNLLQQDEGWFSGDEYEQDANEQDF